MADPATNPTARDTRSWVARAWTVILGHLRGSEIPIEQLDLPTGERQRASRDDRRPQDAVDGSVDESFPASDPPSSTSSHA